MTLFETVSFPFLFLQDNHLLTLALLDDFSGYLGPVHDRLSNLDVIAVGHQQDVIYCNSFSDIAGQSLHPEPITRGNLILFTAAADYCVHIYPPF